MNPIINGYLKNFEKNYGNFGGCSEIILFEHFINWLLAKTFVQEFEIEGLHTGGANDLSIDGIFILINSFIISNYDTAEYYLNEYFKDKKILIDFILIQSKTSEKFDCGDVLKFYDGIKNFFGNGDRAVNENIKEFIKIKDLIFENSARFVKNPNCSIFYASLGLYDKNQDLESIRSTCKKDLKRMSLFNEISITYFDRDDLIKTYKGNQLQIEKTISIPRNVSFPTVDNIKEAYMSIISLEDYIQIVTDEDGNLIKDLFYDNVRDFQGENPVNSEIVQTIKSENQKYFGFLNNGITIVAKEITKVGERLNINNFQIVNGCQTSTILYRYKNKIIKDCYITIKVIGTDDNNIINSIIRATNRQTEVKDEAFESLKEFHKNLEEFYLEFECSDFHKIYYERRNKQYAQMDVPKSKVITLAGHVNSYISMFKEQPHSIHRYYGELLKSYNIFNKRDNLFPYYLSAFCMYKVDLILKYKKKYYKYRNFKYHIILLLRIIIKGNYNHNPESKHNNEYCRDIYKIVENEKKFLEVFDKAVNCLENLLGSKYKHKEREKLCRLKEFTDSLITNLDNYLRK